MPLGCDYGYFVNALKCLKDSLPAGNELFQGTGVNVCSRMDKGIWDLLLALMMLANLSFQTKFRLGMILPTHATFSAFFHGFESK